MCHLASRSHFAEPFLIVRTLRRPLVIALLDVLEEAVLTLVAVTFLVGRADRNFLDVVAV